MFRKISLFALFLASLCVFKPIGVSAASSYVKEQPLKYPVSCPSALDYTEAGNEISSPSNSFTMAGDTTSGGYPDRHLGCVAADWLANCEHDTVSSVKVYFDIGGLLADREDADGLWGYVSSGSQLNSIDDLVEISGLGGASVGYDGIGWGSGATSQDRIWYDGPVVYGVVFADLPKDSLEALRFNFLWTDDHTGVPVHDVYVNNIRLEVEYKDSGKCAAVGAPRAGIKGNVIIFMAVCLVVALGSVLYLKRRHV